MDSFCLVHLFSSFSSFLYSFCLIANNHLRNSVQKFLSNFRAYTLIIINNLFRFISTILFCTSLCSVFLAIRSFFPPFLTFYYYYVYLLRLFLIASFSPSTSMQVIHSISILLKVTLEILTCILELSKSPPKQNKDFRPL